MRHILFLIFLLITLRVEAFVEVKGSQFYYNEAPWRVEGVNIAPSHCNKQTLQELSNFGWNSVRIAPTSLQQLKQIVRLVKREQLKICVVVSSALPLESLREFRTNRQIWAWEVMNDQQAKLLRIQCPNHLITVSLDLKLSNLDNVIMSSDVDFVSIPLTPFEHGWVAPTSLYLGLRNCYMKSNELFQKIFRRSSLVEKPILVSECSYPRDKMFKFPGSPTSLRDSFFSFVINYTCPNTGKRFSGVYFTQWEPLPNESNQQQITPMAIYATDSLTQNILF